MNINKLHDLVKRGDKSAEKQLFQQLSVSFRLFVQHRIWNDEDAEEIVQETLLVVLRKYKGIEFTTSFAAWSYNVLEKNILDYYRTKGRRNGILMNTSNDNKPDRHWEPDPVLRLKLLDCLNKLNTVNKQHARIVNLRYQGYTVENICEKLKIRRNNVYKSLSRARAMIMQCLETGALRE